MDHVQAHQALFKWSTGEMQFQSSSGSLTIPSEEDFKILLKPPLTDVWTYVTKRLKAAENVKAIKSNLILQKHLALSASIRSGSHNAGEEGSELECLVRRKDRLLCELGACQAEVAMLEAEGGRVAQDVTDTETEYQCGLQRVRDLQKKDSMLAVVQACGSETVDRYTEYCRRVTQRAQEVIAKRTNNAETTYSTGRGEETESQCCRDVRLACEGVSSFLTQALDGKLTDQQVLDAAKSDLYTQVDQHTRSHSACALVDSLTHNTLISACQARDDTASLNIQQDIKDLSFSLSTRGLEDLSQPPTVQDSLHQLLQESNQEHIQRWLQEQEHKNQAWKLEARLDNLLGEINKHITKTFGGHPENVALAKRYSNALITCAIEACVAPCLREVVVGLRARQGKARAQTEQLRAKFTKIQDFRALVDKKQCIIEVLARQNSAAPDRLSGQRSQVRTYVSERSVSQQQKEVKDISLGLKGSLTQEVDRFSQILMPSLLTVALDNTRRQGSLSLSLAPTLHPGACRTSQFYANLCEALAYPAHQSVDGLLSHVMALAQSVQDLQWNAELRQHSRQAAQRVAGTDDDVAAIVDKTRNMLAAMCEEVRQHEARQRTTILPQLKRSITAACSHIGEVEGVNKSVDMWWEQPAQNLTPWVTSEDVTFDQWMKRWRTLVAQVHKNMMQLQTPRKGKQ